jgi:ribosome-associated protein
MTKISGRQIRRLELEDREDKSLTISTVGSSATSKSPASTGPKAEPILTQSVSKTRPTADESLSLILSRLDDMKAEDTVTIDLRGKSSIADYMVITTGRANRHVGAIAENVVKGLGEVGIKGVHVEGLQNSDWVLIDTNDVIVHVFRPEVRTFYSLEKMWMPIRPAATAS